MLTCAKFWSFEIHTRTIIPFAVGSTIHYLVLVIFLWIANDIFARAKFIIYTTDIEVFCFCHLFAKFDLPFFQSHFCWFNDMRNLDFFLFLCGFLCTRCCILGILFSLASFWGIVLCHCLMLYVIYMVIALYLYVDCFVSNLSAYLW